LRRPFHCFRQIFRGLWGQRPHALFSSHCKRERSSVTLSGNTLAGFSKPARVKHILEPQSCTSISQASNCENIKIALLDRQRVLAVRQPPTSHTGRKISAPRFSHSPDHRACWHHIQDQRVHIGRRPHGTHCPRATVFIAISPNAFQHIRQRMRPGIGPVQTHIIAGLTQSRKKQISDPSRSSALSAADLLSRHSTGSYFPGNRHDSCQAGNHLGRPTFERLPTDQQCLAIGSPRACDLSVVSIQSRSIELQSQPQHAFFDDLGHTSARNLVLSLKPISTGARPIRLAQNPQVASVTTPQTDLRTRRQRPSKSRPPASRCPPAKLDHSASISTMVTPSRLFVSRRKFQAMRAARNSSPTFPAIAPGQLGRGVGGVEESPPPPRARHAEVGAARLQRGM